MLERILESIKKRKEAHIKDYEDLDGEVELQLRVASRLDELEQIEKLIDCYNTLSKVARPGKWIPCSERLPTKEDVSRDFEFIVMIGDARLPTSLSFNADSKEWYDSYDDDRIYDDVKAWQPLPEPYKGCE